MVAVRALLDTKGVIFHFSRFLRLSFGTMVIVLGQKLCLDFQDMNNNDLKAVFLVPVSMGKIYLQSDRDGQIEVDGTLLDDLLSVGLYTEIGNLKVRDLEAVEVKLASRMGDILCEGHLDGHIIAETFGDGDFLAR